MQHAIAQKSYWKLITGLVIIGGMVLCSLRVPAFHPPQPISPWRTVPLTNQLVHPLVPPSVLSQAVFWRPLGGEALVYSSLDQTQTRIHDWLRGDPIDWRILEGTQGIYLLWRTVDNRLWFAALTHSGEQITAPVELAAGEVSQFEASLTPQQELNVVWVAQGSLFLRTIDPFGRPLPTAPLNITAVQMALAEWQDHLLLVWQTGNQLWHGEVNLNTSPAQRVLENRQTLTTLHLGGDEWLASLDLLLTEQQRIVVWGVTSAQQPDFTRYQGVLLPLEALADPQPFELMIPSAEGLRWLNTSPNSQQATLAALIDGIWQPVVVGFGTGGIQGYQVVDGLPVTGSPIGFQDDPLTLAWVTLDAAQNPRLEVVTLDSRYGDLRYESVEAGWQTEFYQNLRRFPVWLGWLILPLGVAWVWSDRPYWLPVAMAVYWLGKALLPLGTFQVYPALLTEVGTSSPFWGSFLILVLISRLATLMAYIGWGNTPDSLRHAAYFLTDALLTCAIFGGSIQ